VAERLRAVLAGRRLVRFEAARLAGGPRPRPGESIVDVSAQGKHLLIRFERGVVLHTHLRMTGSWHVAGPGERWPRAAHLARVVLEVEGGWSAVCFAAPVVRTYLERPGLPSPVAHLGPDLCDPAPDLAEALRRARNREDTTPLCDLLLDQRVAAGIGNVYKSEVLWACRRHPATPLDAVDEPARRELYEVAHRFLRANLSRGRRVTHGAVPGGLAVYGRRGRPCPRCGSPVAARPLGTPPRSTFWCPRCQPPPGGEGG
jgi:endonuclease-8